MKLNPYATPDECERPDRPGRSVGWFLFGSISGFIGLGILSAEAVCLLWMGMDREFRRVILSGGDAFLALGVYGVIGLLFVASAHFAFLGRRRLAFAFFVLPIAVFSIALQVTSK